MTMSGAEGNEVILVGAEGNEVILAGAEGNEVILVRACPITVWGRDRSWKRFADVAVPKTVDSYVSSPFPNRIDPISEARHPPLIIWIQH